MRCSDELCTPLVLEGRERIAHDRDLGSWEPDSGSCFVEAVGKKLYFNQSSALCRKSLAAKKSSRDIVVHRQSSHDLSCCCLGTADSVQRHLFR